MVDLSVIIVSWNVRELLKHSLSSLMSADTSGGLELEIVVVDAASHDGSPDMVSEHFPGVRLIASKENLGFSRGSNLGAAASHGRYLMLLNPDTRITGDALRAMVRYMDAHADVGALGPKIRYPDGRIQPSRRRFPTLGVALLESTVLQPCFPRAKVLESYYVRDRTDDEEQDVDWVTGACLLVRREAWEQTGPLDEAFFMYSEELDWCRRLKALRWRVIYLPSASIVHYEAQSSTQVQTERHIYFQSSKVLYFRKHHGTLFGEFVRLFLLATYLHQLCLETAKWILGHKRSLRVGRIAAYRRVLASGLRAPGRPL